MTFDLKFYWKIFLRRFPVMALFVLVCAGGGIFAALNTPDTYTSTARLLVEAPQIPDSMVESTVSNNEIEQLDTIQQRLLTRANVLQIAREFEVYENLDELLPDEIVAKMYRDTTVRRFAGRDQATTLMIRFTARSGQIAANVVNRYVTIVLEANAEFRTTRATSTLRFFEQEVERLGQELDLRSLDIATFKSENADALPENQDYRLNRLTVLQERISRLELDVTLARSQRDDLVRIFETTGRINTPDSAVPQVSPQQLELAAAQAELDAALEIYSAENPRVQRLVQRVDRLQAAADAAAEAAAAVAVSDQEVTDAPLTQEMALYRATLSDLDSRIAAAEAEIDSTRDEIAVLEVAISRSAANGVELAGLERDYDVVQRELDAAVVNLNDARMSERIESTAQGQRITEIDPASVPSAPTGPSRTKIAAVGLAMGLGLAGLYFVALEFLNRRVRRPAELMSRFEVTPLATIPYMESAWGKVMRRGGLVLTSVAVLVGVPVALWYVDTNIISLNVVVQMGLDRLGLG